MPINSSVFPALSCTSFKVSGLILRSLIHFELTHAQDHKHGSSFSFLNANIQLFPTAFFQEAAFSLSYIFGPFVSNQMDVAVWFHIWCLYSVPLLFIPYQEQ
jgi:hypothetical protein